MQQLAFLNNAVNHKTENAFTEKVKKQLVSHMAAAIRDIYAVRKYYQKDHTGETDDGIVR